MASTMKKVMQGVLADALQANSPKAKRKIIKQRKLLNVVESNTLQGANTALNELSDRWILQQKAMLKAGLGQSDKEWIAAHKAHKQAMRIWLKHMDNIIEP